MKNFKIVLLVMMLLLAALLPGQAFASSYGRTISVFKKAPAVQPFFKNCYGYAVFPTVGKGGFVIGGSYGEGRVYKNETTTGIVKLIKGSIGFQFGGQAFSQIIFFQVPAGL